MVWLPESSRYPPSTIRLFLLQTDARQDAEFQEESRRLSALGLRILGAAVTLLLFAILLAHGLFGKESTTILAEKSIQAGALVGTATFAASFVPWVRRHSVLVGCVSVLLITLGLIWSLFVRASGEQLAGSYNSEVLVLLIVAVLTLGLHPLHTLWLDLAIMANVFLAEYRAVSTGLLQPGQITGPAEAIVLFSCILFATALSAISYRRIYLTYAAHRNELHAAEAARQAQSQLLLSESAATMGRFAATVSHEINTPLGAINSSAQLLSTLPEKRSSASPEKLEKLRATERTIVDSILVSAARMKEVVGRLQRVTNLDRAEILQVDLNELLRDVMELFRAGDHKNVRVRFEPGDLPVIAARPQQLSAVFANLLHNAAVRLHEHGTITVTSQHTGGGLEVTLHDDRDALGPGATKALFEPGFHVTGARVAGSDWGLFSAREMIRRHGGEISAEGPPGHGTVIRVSIPIRGV